MTLAVRVLHLPICRTCQHPIRLHASLQAGECCCCRSRCGLDVGYGCIVCGAFLMGRNDEVLGLCVRCQIVNKSPVAAVTPGSAATGQAQRGPSSAAVEAGHAGQSASRVPGTQLRQNEGT